MAKRGQRLPFTVRYRFQVPGARDWALGSYATRDDAEFAAQQQRKRVGPNGQTCEAWIVDRTAP